MTGQKEFTETSIKWRDLWAAVTVTLVAFAGMLAWGYQVLSDRQDRADARENFRRDLVLQLMANDRATYGALVRMQCTMDPEWCRAGLIDETEILNRPPGGAE